MQQHRFDPISFVFGLLFVSLAALFALPIEPWDVFFGGIELGWLWPLVIIAAGVALLAPSFRQWRKDGDEPEESPAEL
jgi:hypothetical protein